MAADEIVDAAEVFESLTNLVAKSLLLADETAGEVFYRLLDTTRAYALEKLRDSEELAQTQQRHAQMRRTSPGSSRAAPLSLAVSRILTCYLGTGRDDAAASVAHASGLQ